MGINNPGEGERVAEGVGDGEEEGAKVDVGTGVGEGEGAGFDRGNSSIQPAKSETVKIAAIRSPFLITLFIIQPFLCTIRIRIKRGFGST
jgi:hypothetical protein